MKRILVGVALLGTAAGAQAADLPAKKVPYTKAPMLAVYNWTGFYVGVNAGVGLGRNRTQLFNPGNMADSLYLSPQGGLGGGQIGYNWQTDSLLGPLVLGVEADIQGAGLTDNRTSLNSLSVNPVTTFSQKTDWFGTARGRIGLAHGPVLSYVTAGYAFGSVKTSVTEAGVGVLSTSRTQGGWTVGSGVEAALGGNWTGKIEYLYLDLGNKSDTFALGTQTLNTEIRENIFRAGLNYRIGGNSNYAPVMAANWTGFYLGGNFGSGTGRDRSSLAAPVATELFNLAPDGINGGVQAGYNWQAANWVYGLEADFQGSTQKDSKTCITACLPITSAAYEAKLPWLGTVRGRLGYSAGSTLFYVTGGYAYGSVKTRITINDSVGVTTAQLSNTKGGWTAGAGIETPFTLLGLFGPNWTSKTEYLYVDLGSTTNTFATFRGTPLTATTNVTEHIFRTGLNYHFNTPVVAKY